MSRFDVTFISWSLISIRDTFHFCISNHEFVISVFALVQSFTCIAEFVISICLLLLQLFVVRFWSVKLPYGVHPSTLYVCAFVVAIQATSNAISVIKDLVVRSFMLNFCWELKLLCDCFCLLCIIIVFNYIYFASPFQYGIDVFYLTFCVFVMWLSYF